MHETAALLCDNRLPVAGYRQWVLSVPWTLRYMMAREPGLLSMVLDIFLRAIFTHQRRRARARGIAHPRTGSVTFVQRFGGGTARGEPGQRHRPAAVPGDRLPRLLGQPVLGRRPGRRGAGLRSPIALERLRLTEDGKVRYRLKRPWPTPAGITHLTLAPLDFEPELDFEQL